MLRILGTVYGATDRQMHVKVEERRETMYHRSENDSDRVRARPGEHDDTRDETMISEIEIEMGRNRIRTRNCYIQVSSTP